MASVPHSVFYILVDWYIELGISLVWPQLSLSFDASDFDWGRGERTRETQAVLMQSTAWT